MNKPLFDSDITCIKCGHWYTPEAFIDEDHVCYSCQKTKVKSRERAKLCKDVIRMIDLLLLDVSNDNEGDMVYLVRGIKTQLVKVGFTTTSPMKRMADLQVGSPDILLLCGYFYGSFSIEHELHKILKPFNSHREWFDLPPQVYRCLMRYCRHDIF